MPTTNKRQKKRSRHAWRTARTSDRHELYEASVQEPAAEIAFIERAFRERRGALPVVVREDFCGTGYASCEWVKHRKGNRAFGIDLCEKTMGWGRKRHWDKLTAEQRGRMKYVKGNVLTARTEPADVLAALNFSYFIFKKRADLVRYFKAAFSNLRPGGVIVLDSYGGHASFSVQAAP